MKTLKFCAMALLGIGLALSAAPAVAQQQPIKLRFGKLGPFLGMARPEVAQTQGFFKKHGLEVEVTQFRASPELLTAIVSGAVDIGISGLTSVITGHQRNLPLKAFYVETVAPYYYLLASPNIKSMQDAIDQNASAGVSGIGTLDYAMTRYLFKKAGLNPDKLKYIQAGTPGQRTAALESSRVQVAISSVPEKYAVLRRGKVHQIAKMSDYSKNFGLEVLWSTNDYIANNGEAIRRFLAAMDDAAEWIRTSPEAPAFLARFIGFTYPEGQADVKEALKEIRYPTVAEHKKDLNDLLEGLNPLVEDAIERKAMKASSNREAIEQVFDTRYVK